MYNKMFKALIKFFLFLNLKIILTCLIRKDKKSEFLKKCCEVSNHYLHVIHQLTLLLFENTNSLLID